MHKNGPNPRFTKRTQSGGIYLKDGNLHLRIEPHWGPAAPQRAICRVTYARLRAPKDMHKNAQQRISSKPKPALPNEAILLAVHLKRPVSSQEGRILPYV